MTSSFTRISLLATLAFAIAACDARPEAGDTSVETGQAAAGDTVASAGASGAADSAFLATMSDHHQGLIAMAGEAESKATGEAREDAARLARVQRTEQQRMLQHLSTVFGASHTPAIMPSNRAMADSLSRLRGEEYDRGFYHHVVRHHQEGVRMIDSTRPRLRDAEVRTMADSMKAQQQREIAEFESKMGSHAGHE